MKYTVENPTNRKKAVREAGGLKVIGIGDKATVDAEWDDLDLERYEKAGLKIKQTTLQAKADK